MIYHQKSKYFLCNMDLDRIGLIIELITLAVLMMGCCVYIVTIACIQRFRTAVNIIIGNFCLVCGLAATCRGWLDIFYAFYPALFYQYTSLCIVNQYIPFMNNGFPIYALAMITVNRYLIIRHPTVGLLKKRSWAILSSLIPWITVLLLYIPHFVYGIQVNIVRPRERFLLICMLYRSVWLYS